MRLALLFVLLSLSLSCRAQSVEDDIPLNLDTHEALKAGPKLLYMAPCKPMYPQASILSGEEGEVKLLFTISADGQVESAKITQTSGFIRLDKETLSSLRQCKFSAGIGADGKPARANLKLGYKWALSKRE